MLDYIVVQMRKTNREKGYWHTTKDYSEFNRQMEGVPEPKGAKRSSTSIFEQIVNFFIGSETIN